MNMKELRALEINKLQEELTATKKELLSLRIQRYSEQSVKPHLFGIAKKKVARIKTILKEKGLNNE